MLSPPDEDAVTGTWTRDDAAAACQDLGEDYYLARVESAAEQDWLRTTLYTNFLSFDRAYIGGIETIGDWTWLIGKRNFLSALPPDSFTDLAPLI